MEVNSILTTALLALPYKKFVKQTEIIQQLAFPSVTQKVTSEAFGESEEEGKDKKDTDNQSRRSFYRKKGLGSAPVIRECARCKVRETPMWRSGPQGKGTLCNACGVKWSLSKHAHKTTRGYRKRGSTVKEEVEQPRRSTRRNNEQDDQDEEEEEADSGKEDTKDTDEKDEPQNDSSDKENMDGSEDFFKEGQYYCRYCEKTWPLDSFKNGQQFGAHCSNCSRRKRKQAPTSVSSRRKDKKYIQRRTLERQERMLAARNNTATVAEASDDSLSDGQDQSKKRKKDSDVVVSSVKKMKTEESTAETETTENAVDADLKCAESIEEEVKEGTHERVEDNSIVHAENTVNNEKHVNGEQRRLRQRRNVHTVAESRKAKDNMKDEDSDKEVHAVIAELSEESEEEEEEEEEEFDKDGNDLRFYERVGDTAQGLLTTIEAERKQKKVEKKLNMIQRGLIVLRNDVNLREETQKKERKLLKEYVTKELTGMRHEFEYSVEIIKARFGHQLRASDEEERSSLEAFSKSIESMVETLQSERDQISAVATSQRTQNQLLSQLEQVTRLFGHGCEASLDAIRREGGETGRDCFAEIDRVDKNFHATLQATEEEIHQLFLSTKSSFLEATTDFRKNIGTVDTSLSQLELPCVRM